MSIRRRLRRWFGEPEPPPKWVWRCPECGTLVESTFLGGSVTPFRDTGSGDRDAGVDALVDR